MIVTEIAIALAMFLWGVGAGIAASVMNVLGRGSRAARAVMDVLIAFSFAAAFFFGLFFAASGEFRMYSFLSFLAGAVLSLRLCVRLYPHLRRVAKRVFSPLISIEKRLEKKVSDMASPFLAKRKNRIEARRAKRREEKAQRAEIKARRKKERAEAR